MTTLSVILYLAITFPGQPPVTYTEKSDSVEHCTRDISDFAANPPHAIIIAGGSIQVSCIVEIPPSVEH